MQVIKKSKCVGHPASKSEKQFLKNHKKADAGNEKVQMRRLSIKKIQKRIPKKL